LRGAIQKFLNEQKAELPLTEISTAFIRFWLERLGEEVFVATFLPPDMAWFSEYQTLVETGKLPAGSTLFDDLKKRIDWEITSEYGFNSRIGRTLEKTGSSVALVEREGLGDTVKTLCETLREEIGLLRDLNQETLLKFLAGFLNQMRTKGALFHPALNTYIANWGGYYLINKIPWMPNFGRFSRTPVFLTTKRGTRFDTLLSVSASGITWYEDWLRKHFGQIHPQIPEYREQIFDLVIKELLHSGILGDRNVKGFPVWGMNAERLHVTNRVVQFRCQSCSHNVSVAADEADLWQDNACLRFSCRAGMLVNPPHATIMGASMPPAMCKGSSRRSIPGF